MSQPLDRFDSTLELFLKKVYEHANTMQKKHLDSFHSFYQLGMSVSPRKTVKLFIDTVKPYAHHIIIGDEDFFMNSTFDLDDENNALYAETKNMWPSLNNQTKKFIKDRIKLLLVFGAIYINDKELIDIINMYRSSDNQI